MSWISTKKQLKCWPIKSDKLFYVFDSTPQHSTSYMTKSRTLSMCKLSMCKYVQGIIITIVAPASNVLDPMCVYYK